MRKLGFNPRTVIAFLMQDSAHGVPETVTGGPTMITQHLDHLIDTRLTHRLTGIIAAGEH
ncbi:Uncharacterised protein [Yersinia pseudotuberculosis]|uniref:Uncharacterized protein n=1 Tax=Yersinia pseudotuberculosis serotype O:1b (strain IP 31758) TaxID=349747 RepID=A0A0U1QX18_YERP3|nr:hypothetical protein YpsIP31758_1383 [Yersinia pseudotuberculosis IP 31758]AJK16152.1 hypothetical protein BZ19_2013 [Yersinia pseudotuberculosis str. PA3606]UFA61038.1 Uncharacterized protein YP598_1417 [Yersinia pseudotuberculosis]CNI36010.1 Uncharacterised protein [Yersinia pseudotuberculosis]CNI59876.1 Uncharacterised protein [Yersinia pseudotuberculosis]